MAYIRVRTDFLHGAEAPIGIRRYTGPFPLAMSLTGGHRPSETMHAQRHTPGSRVSFAAMPATGRSLLARPRARFDRVARAASVQCALLFVQRGVLLHEVEFREGAPAFSLQGLVVPDQAVPTVATAKEFEP